MFIAYWKSIELFSGLGEKKDVALSQMFRSNGYSDVQITVDSTTNILKQWITEFNTIYFGKDKYKY